MPENSPRPDDPCLSVVFETTVGPMKKKPKVSVPLGVETNSSFTLTSAPADGSRNKSVDPVGASMHCLCLLTWIGMSLRASTTTSRALAVEAVSVPVLSRQQRHGRSLVARCFICSRCSSLLVSRSTKLLCSPSSTCRIFL